MKKVKTFTFDPAITRPVTLRHVADEDLIFKSETENFNFGLQLKSYNVLENLKDRKSNYNSAYFLSDLQSGPLFASIERVTRAAPTRTRWMSRTTPTG